MKYFQFRTYPNRLKAHARYFCFRGLDLNNTFVIFLKPLILPVRSAGKIKGFRKMAIMLLKIRFLFFGVSVRASNACSHHHERLILHCGAIFRVFRASKIPCFILYVILSPNPLLHGYSAARCQGLTRQMSSKCCWRRSRTQQRAFAPATGWRDRQIAADHR